MDKDTLLEDIDFIYQTATSPSLWPELAAALKERIGCVSVQYLSGNQHTGEMFDAYSSVLKPEDYVFYQKNIYANDGLVAAQKANPPGNVAFDSAIFSKHLQLDSQSYQEFYQYHGMYNWIFTDLVRTETERMFLTFARSEQDRAFSNVERDYFQKLVPHLQNAQTINQRFRAAQRSNQNTFDFFNQMQYPVLAVKLDLKLVHLNWHGEQLLLNNVIKSKSNYLMLSEPNSQRHLRALLHDIENNQIMPHCEQEIRFRHYTIKVLAMNADSNGEITSAHQIVLLLFDDAENTQQKVERLGTLYALTNSEQKIVNLLLEGLTSKDIAELLNVSTNTVRFHLKNTLSKTSTHSQKELILLFK